MLLSSHATTTKRVCLTRNLKASPEEAFQFAALFVQVQQQKRASLDVDPSHSPRVTLSDSQSLSLTLDISLDLSHMQSLSLSPSLTLAARTSQVLCSRCRSHSERARKKQAAIITLSHGTQQHRTNTQYLYLITRIARTPEHPNHQPNHPVPHRVL